MQLKLTLATLKQRLGKTGIPNNIAAILKNTGNASAVNSELKKLLAQQKAHAQKLINSNQAAWVNDALSQTALLIQPKTGLLIKSMTGEIIWAGKQNLPTSQFTDANFLIQLKKFEGFVSHMYKDTTDHITIGKGTRIFNESHAIKLHNSSTPFYHRGNNQKASDADIIIDYKAIEPVISAQSHPFYKKYTNLDIREADADIQALKHMHANLPLLKNNNHYRDFDTFPVEVQLALADLVYNAGAGVLSNKQGAKGLVNWPNFRMAIAGRDWETAAVESHRFQVRPIRNNDIKDAFNKAIGDNYIKYDTSLGARPAGLFIDYTGILRTW